MNIITKCLFFLVMVLAGCVMCDNHKREPVKIIFDTDMVTDYDDMGALACLHALASLGECEILATVSSTRGNGSVAAIEICNNYYGRGEIPVGSPKLASAVSSANHPSHKKFLLLQKKYPKWFKYANSDESPDAVEVYRRVLANQPDGSVVICSVGFLSNLRALLESKGDKYSPLNGKELVAKKVKKWVAMACFYPKGHEYNSKGDPESSKIALRDWPTPIVVTDFQFGRHLYSGRALVEAKFDRNPVYDVYKVDMLPCEKVTRHSWDQLEGHPSWDQSAVLVAVCSEYFAFEPGEYEIIDNTGLNIWRGDSTSKNCRVVEKVSRANLGRIIDELMLRAQLLENIW